MTERTSDSDAANAVMLWRIYDVLMVILRNTNEKEADKLVRLHDDGYFITPPPSYRTPVDEEQND